MIMEILYELEQAKTFQQRVEVLRQYKEHQPLIVFLKHALDPEIDFYKWKEEDLMYSPNSDPLGFSWTCLEQLKRMYYIWMKNDPRSAHLTMEKRKQLLEQHLDGLHPDEAKVFLNVIHRKNPWPKVTKKLVATVFPKLLNGVS